MKHPARGWLVRGACLTAGLVLFWLALIADRPVTEVAALQISSQDGSTRTLTLWEARPFVNISLFEIPVAYVALGRNRVKLHGRGFGENAGEVLISPNHDKAVALRRFKNSVVGAVVIDLRTGQMIYTEDKATWEEVSSWERHSWWGSPLHRQDRLGDDSAHCP